MKLIKNPRIILWVLFTAVALLLISPNPNPRGFAVTSVSENSPAGLEISEVVYKINGGDAVAGDFDKYYSGIVKIETSKGTKFVQANGTLGITVDKAPTTNLKFGLDLKGGVRAVIEPNVTDAETISQIISTLQTRINVYGLRESVFRPVYHEDKGFVEVSIAGGTLEELKSLIESQGKFEAKIPLEIPVADGKATLQLDKSYAVAVTGSSITIDGKDVEEGGSFILNEISFVSGGLDDNRLNLTATVFSGNDVVTVFFDPQRSRVEQTTDGYTWSFGVQLSPAGAQRFGWVTQNTNILPNGYLNSPIVFYLDDKMVDSLSIASTLRGAAETEISISGPASTMEEAVKVRSQLQSILRSGALPTTVEIVQLDSISPTLGATFLRSAVFAALAALLGVVVLVSLRYRKPKLVVPMVFISITEILIVVGVSSAIGWTIDLAAIAGLIASVGTGISDQIIILDRTLRKEEQYVETLHEKVKKAFFVVFGTAGTIIAAMLPLLFTGFGILRGFALITIIGVLVGILITRPAYGVIVERMTKE